MAKYRVIGLMSGTSLDGVDLAFAEIDSDTFTYKLLTTTTVAYSNQWIKTLKEAFYFSKEKLASLDVEYGNYLAETINYFIEQFDLTNIDFIASHGHTIHHQPEKGYTLQIGSGKTIAKKTKLKTVCNFREQDVKLGGQGAPLVPIGDKLLFSEYDYCLNLGGFSNISFEISGIRKAFDICPVNIVLNHYANKIGLPYDNRGKIAKSGKVNQELLNELNNLEFYKGNSTKSLGYEFVVEIIFPILDKYKLEIATILRTFVEHIAIQIAIKLTKNTSLLITGGGVFNTFLIERLIALSSVKIHLPTTNLINYKEALIFALLGVLRVEEKVNCLQSVTGASKNHSSGYIFEI